MVSWQVRSTSTKLAVPEPQKKEWPKSRWTLERWLLGLHPEVQNFALDAESCKKVTSTMECALVKRWKGRLAQWCMRNAAELWMGEGLMRRSATVVLDHPSPKDQRYYLVGPKHWPVPVNGETVQVLDSEIDLRLFTTTSARDDRIKLEVEHAANSHPIIFTVDTNGLRICL